MSAIEDVHEELDADVSTEEFEEMVAEKVEEMGGLADDETAAMLVAHELEDEGGEVEGVADIEPGMDEVKFVAKIVSIGELRTFEREGDQEDGQVVNAEVADETGRIRLSLWDEMAEGAIETLQEGEVLRIAGRPKEGYNGVEVSADKAEVEPGVDIEVSLGDSYTVEELSMGRKDVTLVGELLDVDADYRTFDRDDGSQGRVGNCAIGDETGRIRVTLWDEATELLDELAAGEVVEVVDGYVREREGDLELHVGSRGTIEEVDEDVEYVPDTADIESVEMDDTVDIAGAVIETDEKRTFDRDDGSQGQVRNVRIRDDTGDIRVALWGDKADRDIELADRVAFTDVEIQDGWQDELEASAGWQSTVSLLEGEATLSSERDAGDRAEKTPAGQGGLSSFADGDGSDTTTDTADAAEDFDGEAVAVEFTGTVVQSGSPVVLDSGDETRSVETSESVRLGEEVTVRGVERDGRIDADELF
ncbi:MAG: single-stranded DNA binding protein [Halolamina sp.]|uniref:single-stranded DNA binding protein n=1 Tax=Halolamina sp. TaxID=1940283 RepID=UPI002FC30ECC